MQLDFKTLRVECFNVGCAVDGWTENVIVRHSDNHMSCTGKLLYVFLREICIFLPKMPSSFCLFRLKMNFYFQCSVFH